MIDLVLHIKYRNLYKQIALGILGLIGTSIILILSNRCSAGLTPDSVAYISAARNLVEGNEFLTYNGTYLVAQPPLYPIVLALIKRMAFIDPLISATYVNAILFGFIIYFSGLLLLRYLKSFTLVVFGIIWIMISYALVQSSLMALSEPLFIFFVILFLYYFERYRSKRNLLSLFTFSVFVSLACLTRYTGIVIILTGIICISIWGKKPIKEKIWDSLIFILISVLPIGIWIIRNYLLTGTLVGQRASSLHTLFENFSFFYNTILLWYLPPDSTYICLIIIFLLLIAWVLHRLTSGKSLEDEAIGLVGPALLFVLFYSGTIVVSSTTTAYDRISDRLLSPIYIPVIFILFFVTDKILSWLSKSFNSIFLIACFAIGLIVLVRYPIKNTVHFIKDYIELSGWGYSCNLWRESETIRYLLKHRLLGQSYTLYSNEPAAVYILANLETKCSPAKTFYNSPQLFNIDSNPKDCWLNEKRVCLIWFDKANRNFLFPIDELQKKVNMIKIAHLEDGEIYIFMKE